MAYPHRDPEDEWGLTALRNAKSPYRDWGPRDPFWIGLAIYAVLLVGCIVALCLVGSD